MNGTAVVPAAGRGERFGGGKLLASVDGMPMLQRTLGCLLDAGLAVVVVTAPDVDFESVDLLRDSRVRRVVNPDPARGMFSSIQVGLNAIADGSGPILVLPADMPFVQSSTATLVRDECLRRQATVVPTFNGERGHPMAIPAALRRPLAETAPGLSLKDALQVLGATRVSVPVSDPGVLRDVDVPSDLADTEAGTTRPV